MYLQSAYIYHKLFKLKIHVVIQKFSDWQNNLKIYFWDTYFGIYVFDSEEKSNSVNFTNKVRFDLSHFLPLCNWIYCKQIPSIVVYFLLFLFCGEKCLKYVYISGIRKKKFQERKKRAA